MNTRTIGYIDDDEDLLEVEVETALNRSMNQNFIAYCKLIRSIFAMSDIETINFTGDKTIYFIENEY
ncbi:MAG: hypothetical protein L3J06_05560 [Cyclobacteriaceae bacterium]|nr:hypothetical protein [Cyclobacteriaceae bacterium]